MTKKPATAIASAETELAGLQKRRASLQDRHDRAEAALDAANAARRAILTGEDDAAPAKLAAADKAVREADDARQPAAEAGEEIAQLIEAASTRLATMLEAEAREQRAAALEASATAAAAAMQRICAAASEIRAAHAALADAIGPTTALYAPPTLDPDQSWVTFLGTSWLDFSASDTREMIIPIEAEHVASRIAGHLLAPVLPGCAVTSSEEINNSRKPMGPTQALCPIDDDGLARGLIVEPMRAAAAALRVAPVSAACGPTMPVSIISGELYLDGDVGDCGFADYFTAREVAQALANLGTRTKAKVRLNSGGGIASEGAAIAAAFRAHKPGVEVTIESVCASAATIAACAAARCTIGFGSLYMVHEAAGWSVGPADTHRDTARQLDVINDVMATSYAAKTGRSAADMRAMMKEETWMGAEAAVANGFCDAVVGAPADHPAFAAFDYRQYKHASASVLARAERSGLAKPCPRVEQERAAQIADMCNAVGVPEMASELLRANISVAEACKRAEAAQSRKRGCELSRASMEKIIRSHGEVPVGARH